MRRRRKKIEVNIEEVDCLNIDLLRRFVSGEGKAARIVSRHMTGVTARCQRKITKAIKRARQLNLM